MGNVDSFFDGNLKQLKLDSTRAMKSAARELERDVKRQIRKNFNNPSLAFQNGVKVHDYEGGSYVRLSPILSSHAKTTKLSSGSNLWILLPDGKRLGFKRMGTDGFNWNTLKRRYGTRISFVPVGDGHVVLYRSRYGIKPVYKIQISVTTKQRIDFYDHAEEIAKQVENSK